MAGFSKVFRSLHSSYLWSQLRYRKPHKPWQNYEAQKGFRRNLWLMNGGILMSVFAGCYLMVPLYKQFCQTTGLVGDDMKKDYSKVVQKGMKGTRLVTKSPHAPEVRSHLQRRNRPRARLDLRADPRPGHGACRRTRAHVLQDSQQRRETTGR